MAGILCEIDMKRLFDIFASIILLIILSPLMVSVSIMILIVIGPPILFRQQRPGLHGVAFIIYKFRTMTNDVDKHGQLLPDKDRLTTIGHLLRRFSLDELPQLFNVLVGDLSLVGPRPLLMEYMELYTPAQARRHAVRPGITGWAQINGRNAISWEQRFEMDVWYVDHQSFWLDVKILVLTLLNVVRGDGISQDGHVTMEKFKGSRVE